MSVLTSGEFWAFVGVMAGIYTLFALGLQVQFGLAGLLNFGQVGFMAIGAYTMAILVAKEGWSMWLATPLAIAAAALAGVLVGLPTLRLRGDYFAIVTIAFSEIVRWVATNEDGLTGGAQGTINLAGPGAATQYNGQWERLQGWVGSQLHIGDKDVVMLLIVWSSHARPRCGSPPASHERRGDGCSGRSGRTKTQRRPWARTCSVTASRRSRSAPRSPASPGVSTRGSSRSSARTTSSR